MPKASQLHVDQLLSNVSIAYRQEDFIADQLFPVVPVKKTSDLFRIYERNFRVPETSRAAKGLARQHSFDVSTAAYVLERHALKDYVGDSEADNYDIADLRTDTTEELTGKIQMRMEKSVMDLFTTTNWSLNVSLAATALWSLDTVASNPIPLVDTGASTVIANSGKRPNVGVMNFDSFVNVKNHQSVVDRVKYTSQELDEKVIAGLFGLPKLLISKASIDSAAEGVAASISYMLNDKFWMGWAPASPGLKQPSAGYIFKKTKAPVRRWVDEERACEAIEVDVEYQARVVASLCGYLINNVQ